VTDLDTGAAPHADPTDAAPATMATGALAATYADGTTNEPISSARRRQTLLLLTGLLLAQLVASIEGTVLATATPKIVTDLNGFSRFSWLHTAYLVTAATTTPLWGKLSDLFGRRRLYELSLIVFMVGSIICGASTSMTMLIWARALQGVGSGGIFTLTMTIMGDVMSPRERGKYQGYMMGVYAGATVIGPLIGGLLVDHAHWRFIFYMNLPLGLAALAISRVTLNIPFAKREHSIDYGGAFLLIVGVVSALLAMAEGDHWGWSSTATLSCAALAVVATALFLFQERRATEPIIPLRLFREPLMSLGAIIQFASGAAMFAVAIYAPYFLQVVGGIKPTQAGLLVVPATIGMLIGSTGSGRRLTRTGRYRIYPIVGGGIVTVSLVMMASMNRGTNRYLTSAWMLLFGIGAGMIFIVMIVGLQNRVAHADMGIATSANNFFRSLGNTFGTAVFATLFLTRLDRELLRLAPDSGLSARTVRVSEIQEIVDPIVRTSVIQSFTNSLHWVFLLCVPFGVIAFALSWFIPEYPLRSDAAVDVNDTSH
jgi:EmrB/QacA subfamily drug resistance transporter